MAKLRKESVTIKDIAQKMGTSTSTVSRALNNHPKISESTIKKVQKFAKEMGYQPNIPDFFNERKHHKKIAILVPDLQDSLYLSVIHTIQKDFQDYNCVIASSLNSIDLEKRLIDDFLETGIDGIFISLCKSSEVDAVQKVMDKKIPVVLFDNVCFDLHAQKIAVDYFNGAYKAVQHLHSINCEKIALVTDDESLTVSKDFKSGYLASLNSFGIKEDLKFIFPISKPLIQLNKAFDTLLNSSPKFDAVIFTNHFVAMQFIALAKKCSISIPNDMCIVSNGSGLYHQYLNSSVTSVSCDYEAFGSLVVRCMHKQFDNKEQLNNSLIVPTRIIIRSSTLIS